MYTRHMLAQLADTPMIFSDFIFSIAKHQLFEERENEQLPATKIHFH